MPLLDRETADTIELTDSVFAEDFNKSLFDLISVDDSALIEIITTYLDRSDTIELTDSVFAEDFNKSLFDLISVSDYAQRDLVPMPVIPSLLVRSASDSIAVTDSLAIDFTPLDQISVTDYVQREILRDAAEQIQKIKGAVAGTGLLNLFLPLTPVAGNTLIAIVAVDDPIAGLGLFTIAQGAATWVNLTSRLNPNFLFTGEIWVAQNVPASLPTQITLTAAGSGTADIAAVVVEYSGLKRVGTILDQFNTNDSGAGSSDPIFCGATPLTTQPKELWLATPFSFATGNFGISDVAGFTQVDDVSTGGTSTAEVWEFFATSTGIVTNSISMAFGATPNIGSVVALFSDQLEVSASDSISATDAVQVESIGTLYQRSLGDAVGALDAVEAVREINTYTRQVNLDVLMRGFGLSMRVTVAEEESASTDLNISIANSIFRQVNLNTFITNAVDIVIEPDRPAVFEPLVVVDDLETPVSASLHPNAVRSLGTDFGLAGAEPDDVLEILEGVNAGNYIIRVVDGHLLFVEQALEGIDPGPVQAEVRKNQENTPQFEAAVVIDQPVFNNGFSIIASMDVLVA